MGKYVICTLGTSVANKFDREALSAKQRENGKWDDSDPAFEKTLHGFVDGFLNGKGDFSVFSAESAILRKAGLSKDDRVVLLATDSYLGRVCADETARLIANGFGLPDSSVEKVRVEGLQVADAECLRRAGLPNFVREVCRRVEANRYQYDVILCPVGGYKGVIPFLTVLGMAFRLPSLYTFEYINSLVRLPPLPFSLDRDLYIRAKDALRELGARVEMPEGEFLAKINGYTEDERETFLAFVEPSSTPGFVTSGAFTETFAPDFECESAPLSKQAIDDIEALKSGQLHRTACRLVLDVQDPKVRGGLAGNHKKVVSTDLQILKQGNSSLRVLGYVSGNAFMVCRVLAHNDYDRLLDGRSCNKANFPPESFIKWTPPAEELPDSVKPDSIGSDESPFDAAMRQLQESKETLQATIAEWAGKVNDQKAMREAAEKGIGKVQRKLHEAQDAIKGLERENARLGEKLSSSESAWWHKHKEIQSENERLASQLADWKAEAEARDGKLESVARTLDETQARLDETQARLDEIKGMGFFERLFRWGRHAGAESAARRQ